MCPQGVVATLAGGPPRMIVSPMLSRPDNGMSYQLGTATKWLGLGTEPVRSASYTF